MSQAPIFSKPISAHFAQVHLVARGALIPEFQTGDEPAVFGSAGIAVATSDWEHVLVELAIADGEKAGLHFGTIEVGSDGLEIGNDLAGDSHHVEWPAGPITVAVERSLEGDRIATVRFLVLVSA